MAGHSLDDLRAANRRAVTSALGEVGPMSRADLSRTTGLSTSTVSSLVAGLIADGVVVETDDRAQPHKGGSGRPPVLVALAVRPGQVAGIDIGHDYVRVAVADRAGTILAEQTVPADIDRHDSTLDRSVALVEELVGRTGGRVEDLVWAAMCVPGPIDRRSSRLDGAVLPAWRGSAPGVEMQERLGVPVAFDNDANLGAIAEHRHGAGEGASDLVYVHVEGGLGAGLVLAGRLHRGATGIAGEVGHVPVRNDGLACRCGSRGCLETEVAAPRLLELLRPAYGADLDVPQVLDLDAAGDPGVQRVLVDAGHTIGRSLAGLCTVLNPDVVVIGGALGLSASLVSGVRAAVDHFAQPDAAAAVEVRSGVLGNRALIVGAVALAIARAEQYPLHG